MTGTQSVNNLTGQNYIAPQTQNSLPKPIDLGKLTHKKIIKRFDSKGVDPKALLLGIATAARAGNREAIKAQEDIVKNSKLQKKLAPDCATLVRLSLKADLAVKYLETTHSKLVELPSFIFALAGDLKRENYSDVTRELKVHETSLLHWQQTIEQGVTENQGRLENFQFLSAKSISETLTREIERLEKEISAFEVDPMSALSDVDEIDNPKLKQLLLDYGKMVGDRDKREKSVQTTVSEVEDTNKGLDPAKEQVQSMLDQVRDNLRGLENGTSIYSQHVGGRSTEPSLSSDTGEDINFVGERKEETKFPKTEEVIVRGAKPGLMQRLRNRFSSGVTEIRRWFGNALSKIGATIAGLFGRTRSPDSVTDFVEVNGAPNPNSTGRSTGLQGVVYVKTEQNDDGMKFLGLDYKEIDEEPSVDEYIYAEQNNEDILFSDEEDEPMVGDDRPGPDEDLNKTVTPEEIKANIKKAFKDSNISNEIDPELENIEVNVTENISNSDTNMDKDVNVTESGNVIKSGGN